jgi:hypothetical protein
MYKTTNRHFAVIGLLASALITGSAAVADAPATSDFIDKLPALQSSTQVEGGYDWKTPDSAPSEYDRFIIDEAEIFVHPVSDYHGINAPDFKSITETLRIHLIDALEPRYPVVHKSGPGVARVRLAITGVKLEKRRDLAKQAFGVLPFGRAINRSQTPVILLDDASMEMEILDSSTGKRLMVAIDPLFLRHGEEGSHSWESMNESFKLYSDSMRQRMDEQRKK